MTEVLGDWGVSRLRLWRLWGGEVVAGREGPGTGTLAGVSREERLALLQSLIDPWREDDTGARVWLAGMAGSRNGLFEVPYASLPADVEGWIGHAATRVAGPLRVTVAAGLSSGGDDARPDVMRGEEAQVFGALELEPALARGPQLVVLPGTHSKWVVLEDGAVRRFRTAVTGELHALLTRHSTLLDTGPEARAPQGDDGDAGFDEGTTRSLERVFTSALFEARAAQLVAGRSSTWAAGFLSGLVIGREIVELSREFDTAAGVLLIGTAELAAPYARALARAGIATHALDGARCSIAALRRLAATGGEPA